jgi:hypothetical protein
MVVVHTMDGHEPANVQSLAQVGDLLASGITLSPITRSAATGSVAQVDNGVEC